MKANHHVYATRPIWYSTETVSTGKGMWHLQASCFLKLLLTTAGIVLRLRLGVVVYANR